MNSSTGSLIGIFNTRICVEDIGNRNWNVRLRLPYVPVDDFQLFIPYSFLVRTSFLILLGFYCYLIKRGAQVLRAISWVRILILFCFVISALDWHSFCNCALKTRNYAEEIGISNLNVRPRLPF